MDPLRKVRRKFPVVNLLAGPLRATVQSFIHLHQRLCLQRICFSAKFLAKCSIFHKNPQNSKITLSARVVCTFAWKSEFVCPKYFLAPRKTNK